MLVANKLRALNCSFLSIKSSPQSYSKQQQKPNYLFLLFLSSHSGLNPRSLILLTTAALTCTISGLSTNSKSHLLPMPKNGTYVTFFHISCQNYYLVRIKN